MATNAVGGAIEQPFRDLNVIRQETPAPLTKAAKAVYARDEALDCAGLRKEIAVLDETLGPDLDQPQPVQNGVSSFATEALKGAVDLPFRGIVRRISGAYQNDVRHQRAVLAGMVRRGYLKGLLQSRRCDAPTVETLTAAPPPPIKLSSTTAAPPPISLPSRMAPPVIQLREERAPQSELPLLRPSIQVIADRADE